MSTETPHRHYYRRHPYATALGVILLLLSVWIGLFLARFNLNDYRAKLQVELSNQLSLPVTLGEARLQLHGTEIGVSFADLQIGTPQSSVEIRADELLVALAWHRLLLRQLHLSGLSLHTPVIRIDTTGFRSPPGPEAQEPPLLIDISLLNNTSIGSLTINEGTLELQGLRAGAEGHHLVLTGIHGSLDHLGMQQDCRLDLSALLQDGASRLHLHGGISLPTELKGWRQATFDLHLDLLDLQGRLLNTYLQLPPEELRAEGPFDLRTQASGTVDDGIDFRTSLTSEALELHADSRLEQPVPLAHFQLNGTYHYQGQHHLLQNLSGQLHESRIAGEALLNRSPDRTTVHVNLTNSRLEAKDLALLKPSSDTFPGVLARSLQPTGHLWVDQAAFMLTWEKQKPLTGRLMQLAGGLQEIRSTLAAGTEIEVRHLALHQDNGDLVLEHGQGRLGALDLDFSGYITPPTAETSGHLDMTIRGMAAAEKFLPWLAKTSPQQLSIGGPLPFQADLTGPLDNLRTDLSANLDQLDLRFGKHLRLPPSKESRLGVNGRLTPTGFSFEHLSLTKGPLTGRLSGGLSWEETPSLALTGQLLIEDLATARTLSPHTEKLELSGSLAMEVDWQGPFSNLPHPELKLKLRDVAIPTGGAIADISRLNGEIAILKSGLRADRLSAELGRSPVNAKLRLADYHNPALVLDVTAASIRADELIFYSDLTTLRNISGQLRFDAGGLRLDAVSVELDSGTRAIVNGDIPFNKAPKVDLDVTADYANVAEVIGLWTNRSPAADKALEHRRRERDPAKKMQADVRIAAHVKKGDLFGMSFQNAEGLVNPRSDILVIHPLDFRVGQGYCNAQVLVDYSGEGAPLLRISGHGEDIDAYEVHHELLKRKSIVRGNLRGDFYLQGLAGKEFLPSSYGNFNVTIRDGVVRQFPILSKVFSILNVSQLFALQLPDMNLEGLPFSLISAELRLDQGMITTEDLLIRSEAMNQSYVGRFNLIDQSLDLVLGVQPLGTVDKVVSRIPIAGWLLTGEDRALLTAHFNIKGKADNPDVEAVPVTSVSKSALGFVRRTIGLPAKLVTDPSILWGGRKDEE